LEKKFFVIHQNRPIRWNAILDALSSRIEATSTAGSFNNGGQQVHRFSVTYFVPGAGTIQETINAGSEYNVRRLIEARYPNVAIRIVQVTQLD